MSYFWKKFKRHKPAIVGLIVLFFYIIIAVFSPYIAPYDPNTLHIEDRLQKPSAKYLFGTDAFGRDILSRVIYGTRISMTIGILSILIGVIIGGTMGVIAGYFSRLERIIMFIADVLLAFPSILLAIGIMTILGSGIYSVTIAVAIKQIPSFSRMVRSVVLSVKNCEYIEAARALGSSNARIIFKSILPNSLAPILVYSTLQIGWNILLAAILSFLGIGVPAPIPEWGRMVAEGRDFLRQAPHIATFPGIAIFLLVMSFNLIGDSLRDAIDPKLKI